MNPSIFILPLLFWHAKPQFIYQRHFFFFFFLGRRGKGWAMNGPCHCDQSHSFINNFPSPKPFFKVFKSYFSSLFILVMPPLLVTHNKVTGRYLRSDYLLLPPYRTFYVRAPTLRQYCLWFPAIRILIKIE